MPIDSKTISSWVRQARYRAKKHNIFSDLNVADIHSILESSRYCVYCDTLATMLDCPFPLKDGGPNVPANVTPCCKKCKSIKNNNDIVWMFSSEKLTENKYVAILKDLLSRRGGDKIKEHIRLATGMMLDI